MILLVFLTSQYIHETYFIQLRCRNSLEPKGLLVSGFRGIIPEVNSWNYQQYKSDHQLSPTIIIFHSWNVPVQGGKCIISNFHKNFNISTSNSSKIIKMMIRGEWNKLISNIFNNQKIEQSFFRFQQSFFWSF